MSETLRSPQPKEGMVATVEDDWRVLSSDTEKRCRAGGRRPCGRPAVAEVNRGWKPWSQQRDNWWAYCPDHMYGRWIEKGVVMVWWYPS